MKKLSIVVLMLALVFSIAAQSNVYFSTEEEFMAKTPNGLVKVSDGDLLDWHGNVVMTNAQLLKIFQVGDDIGLDAIDVIDTKTDPMLVAFSTELDSPYGQFDAGDLLTNQGAIIPNEALLAGFNLPKGLNLGLDAVQVIGKKEMIIDFFKYITSIGPDQLIANPQILPEILTKYQIDILFSTEGTGPVSMTARTFIDGDLISAKSGAVIVANSTLLPSPIPAGIPSRGVDYGLDSVICPRNLSNKSDIFFSTEILNTKPAFTDGDIMQCNNSVVIADNWVLIRNFNPPTGFLGLDGLSYFD